MFNLLNKSNCPKFVLPLNLFFFKVQSLKLKYKNLNLILVSYRQHHIIIINRQTISAHFFVQPQQHSKPTELNDADRSQRQSEANNGTCDYRKQIGSTQRRSIARCRVSSRHFLEIHTYIFV
jgi:hypothetical protein